MSKKNNQKETIDLVITDEIRQRLNDYAAINVIEKYYHTPDAYKSLPEKYQPKFYYKRISGFEEMQITKNCSVLDKENNVKIDWSLFAYNVCKAGLISWEMYYDINGNIIKFNKELEGLPKTIIYELSNLILHGEDILSDDEKLGLV